MIARKIPDVQKTFAESLEKYLRQGKLEPSCHLILQFAAREDVTRSAVAEAVTQCLDRLLEAFVIEPVVRFCDELDTNLPGDLAKMIKDKIGGRVDMIQQWSGRMTLISRERQARDLRGAIRGRKIADAEGVVAAILVPPPGRSKPDRSLVEYVGSVLGSVEHGQAEVEQLAARLRAARRRLGLSDELLEAMERARRERRLAAERARGEFPEAEFVRDLNALTVELKRWLPSPLATGQPREEDIVHFYQAIHALVASVFLNGGASRWADVTSVLVEYCPRDLSVAGRKSGVEDRAYMTLTPTARRVVFEAFGRLGQNDLVARSYLDFARSVSDERLLRRVVEVMGGMRAKSFLSWLRKTFEGEARPNVRSVALVATSNYADGEAAEFLLRALADAVRRGKRRGSIPEGPARREVVEALFALGRVVRSPRMDPGGRNVIFKKAITLVPEKDERLLHELAYQCFCTPSEGWDAQPRDWAAQTLTRSLWLGDMTPDFASTEEKGQPGVLGWRAPTVQALVAMGRDAVPAVVNTCEESGLRYGGAYVALAEALGQLRDPRALDLLERLLANALLFDGSQRTKYQTEKYYDATEDVRKELTTDQVVAALLFAIERIGSERAEVMLAHAYDQIRAAGATGPESDAVLERVRARLVRDGRWNELVRQATERRAERPEQKEDETSQRRAAAEAIKALRARRFWSGKHGTRKITALQTLGSQRNLEALPLIVAHLEDSDPLVRGAAETALGEYAWDAGNESVFRALFYALLDGLRSRNDTVRESVRTVLRRLGPGREPLRSKLRTINQNESDPLLRAEASRLLLESMETDKLETLGSPARAGEDEEAEPSTEAAEASPAEAGRAPNIDEAMRRKREYLLARREWIRGGKRGDPPKPPPDIQME